MSDICDFFAIESQQNNKIKNNETDIGVDFKVNKNCNI